MERSGKMDRGGETSKGGCSDSGYLGGCERSSHRAPATESGHMSVEHMLSESSDDNGVDIIAPRKEDVMGKEFKTIELAEEYYMSYAKGIGFSVRKDKLVRNSEGKGGETSKGGCSDSGYLGGCERSSHRAPATESGHMSVEHMLSESSDDNGVDIIAPRKEDVMGKEFKTIELAEEYYMSYAKGIGFSVRKDKLVRNSEGKDLYNKLDASRREILLDGDTEAALSYLKAKGAMDPEFFCKFSVDEENRLRNLFWRDSTSLLDYIAYGDVLIFDSTYKTNVYDKPLVLFVGSNNYRSTVMFGCALLQDETFETYKWLLETFLASMKDKKPISILTDGDEAMRKAIDDVFPMSNHRLCSWHVSRNAQNNLKDDELLRNFQACIWEPFALDEFEKKWEVLRERASTPKQKEWLEMMYAKRDAWPESCLRGQFFGGMCTTQRVESMNKYVKDYLRKGVKLFECIPAIDRAILRLRNTTAKEGFNAKYSTPVLKTGLTKLEQQASLIYTHRCFVLVRHEIEACSALTHDNVMHNFGGRVYVLSKYDEPHNNWTCIYHGGENMRIECGCRKYESEGIPCCHLFYVMKCEHLTEIPPALIMKRWTKNGQTDTCREFIGKGEDTTNEVVEMARYGHLSAMSNKVCFYASKSADGYAMLTNEFSRWEGICEGLRQKEEQTSLKLGTGEQCPPNIVKDPNIVRTKGTQARQGGMRKRRQCHLCHGYGHTKRNCSQRNLHPSRHAGVNIPSGSEGYQYTSDIRPFPDISYSYPSQTVSQCHGNYVVNLPGSDSFSTADPTGSTPNSDDGFSFDNGEPNSLCTGSTQNNCSFRTWFTCNN
ncbi:protein FAR1-RELATED SEQUENCE 5 [Prunus persica]|uniref:protein FAR1-RELATED SEQUENCE 5 n=1 Tax=Prunus persica TaxID=3760 RepID=UPI0009AB50A9|nr:protein FAR1-RELATED SEQUENCE 5 [Prunus persica]